MKALSIKQPWAGFIALSLKTIETRTWKTNYRGRILICASKNVDKLAMMHIIPDPIFTRKGEAIAIATIMNCRPMEKADEEKALCTIYPGAYAWVLTNIKIIKPFPIKGELGLFNVSVDEIEYYTPA